MFGTMAPSSPLSGTSYQDGGLEKGATYSYQVKARDVAGSLSVPGNTVTVKVK